VSAWEADRRLTVHEAAVELGLGERIVRRYCQTDRIRAQLAGKTYVISRADLEEFKSHARPVGYPSGKKRRQA